MSTTVADGVTRLGTSAHNFYLLVEGGRATVIDAGCSRELPVLVQALAAQGLTLADVEAVLVTHGHADHIGAARAAADAGVDVRIHVEDVDRARGEYEGRAAVGPTQLPLWKPSVIAFLLQVVRAGVLRQPPVLDLTTFGDGDVLDLPGRPVAVHTPGHTEGHCAFHLPDRRLLFSGDAMVTDAFLGHTGPQMLMPAFHNDLPLALESLARLEALDADMVLPGHGDPFRGRPADMVAAIRRRP